MDQIVNHLFISSWEIAKNAGIISENNIRHILNLGCVDNKDNHDNVTYTSYPTIMDTPETIILNTFAPCNRHIRQCIDRGENILVHCVYGQSRSAAVVVSYLMYNGMTLDNAIECISTAHPNICINPGFLQQLYFASLYDEESPEFKLLTGAPISVAYDPTVVDAKSIVCRSCGAVLCADSDKIVSTVNSAVFTKKHLDSFWNGYRPIRSSNKSSEAVVTLPMHGYTVIYPQVWTTRQMDNTGKNQHTDCGAENSSTSTSVLRNSKSEGVLCCPGCEIECGLWRRGGLNLIGEFNLCDLIALLKTAVKVKRPRPAGLI